MIPTFNHSWNLPPNEAKQLQSELVEQLRFEEMPLDAIQWVAGADVAFYKKQAFACVVLFKFPELICVEKWYAHQQVSFPYVPGFLSFREGEVLLQAFAQLEQEPDVILFDGQGIAHPRKLGLAAHLGLLFDKPSIGCAKSRLVGQYREPALQKGESTPLLHHDERVGVVLRTRTKVKPIFISPGHLMTIDSAQTIALACTTKYRLPEPTRAADKYVGKYKKQTLHISAV